MFEKFNSRCMVTFLVLAVGGVATARDSQWTRRYSMPGSQHMSAIASHPKGGYVLLGTQNPNASWSALVVLFTDSNGRLRKEPVHYSSSPHRGLLAASLDVLENGDLLITGTESGDFFILRTDSEGKELFRRTLPGRAGPYSGEYLTHAKGCRDGGYLLYGFKSYAQPIEQGAWIVKTDKKGAVEWERTFLYSRDPKDRVFSRAVLIVHDKKIGRDTEFVLVAEKQNETTGTEVEILGLDPMNKGKTLWKRTYAASSFSIRGLHSTERGFVATGRVKTRRGFRIWLSELDHRGGIIGHPSTYITSNGGGTNDFHTGHFALPVPKKPYSYALIGESRKYELEYGSGAWVAFLDEKKEISRQRAYGDGFIDDIVFISGAIAEAGGSIVFGGTYLESNSTAESADFWLTRLP